MALPVQCISSGTNLELQEEERDVQQDHSCLRPLEHPAPMPTQELLQSFLMGETGAGAEAQHLCHKARFILGLGAFSRSRLPASAYDCTVSRSRLSGRGNIMKNQVHVLLQLDILALTLLYLPLGVPKIPHKQVNQPAFRDTARCS